MSTSDRDQHRDQRENGSSDERTEPDGDTDTLIAEAAPKTRGETGAAERAADADGPREEGRGREGNGGGPGARDERHGQKEPDGPAAGGGLGGPAAAEGPDGPAAAGGPDAAGPADHGGPAAEGGRDEPAAPSASAEPAHPQDEGGRAGKRLTPRQARRLRILLSAVGMAAMAAVLALRIASRSSVLVVGVYGLALILCGVVIELSRNGRTRLASWLLGVGLSAAVGADWLLLP